MPPEHAKTLRRAIQLVSSGESLLSGQLLLGLCRLVPDHPEVWRQCGIRHAGLNEWSAAVEAFARATSLLADDFELWCLLGTAQDHAGETAAAPISLRKAASLAVAPPHWLKLSLEFDRQGYYDDSLAAIQRLLQLQPHSAVALLQRSRCFKALGNAAQAAADCRTLIATNRLSARAWFSLVDLKTVPLSAAELGLLEKAATLASSPPDERLLVDFALGKALEDAGQVDKAFAAFRRANQAARATHPWDARAFARRADTVQAAFSLGPVEDAKAQAKAQPQAKTQGSEIVFLVGLPRSGTTLVEQVLASHSQVEGASELPYLNQVIEQESRRRGKAFPGWTIDATAADWSRLGQDYLRLGARWRAHKPMSTDKLPENWLLAGAALAMLPDARVVDCRRDPLETIWSCYKQLFGPGRVGFAYDLHDLAAYWQAYDTVCRFWAARYPQHFRAQLYEALVADPEGQIRELLAFCGLPFEPGCLQFHTAQRAIRTPSALQVREPMRQTSTPAARYGALLDPLRLMLAAPAVSPTS